MKDTGVVGHTIVTHFLARSLNRIRIVLCVVVIFLVLSVRDLHSRIDAIEKGNAKAAQVTP